MVDSKKTVAVFGAGVAGLTAAHELAIRGFEVTVYDPEINHVIGDRTLDRGIGGMARSQFVVDDGQPPTPGEMKQLRPASEFLRDATFEFAIDPQGEARVIEARPSDLRVRFLRLVKELVERKQLRKLVIFLPRSRALEDFDRRTDPRFRFLASLVEEAKLATAEDLLKHCTSFPILKARKDNLVLEHLAFFDTQLDMFPAEHGFRFFPSFYRHLFDTMRRTPLTNPRPQETGRRSAYENLVSVEGLGFARAGTATSFLLSRSPVPSFEEFRLNLRKVLGELEWSGEDINRFGLKLFEYMTSCSERREREYESKSWADFVDLRSYTPVMQEHLEFGPQMMASLRGSESDARTQGTIVVQLLLDQLRQGTRPDMTLSGPTSGSWFDHWYDYLVEQGVKFERAKLTRFTEIDQRPVPVLADGRTIGTDYVVLALSLEAMAEVAKELKATLSRRTSADDLDLVTDFLGAPSTQHRSPERGPLRHMSGIQFYFDTEVKFWRGHTQYLDSEWGLTSIAQPQFWSRQRNPRDQYRSLLSVDIGIWDRETTPDSAFRAGKRRALHTILKGDDPIVASACDPQRLAREVWAQIRDHHDEAFAAAYGAEARFPEPISFALDDGLTFDAGGLAHNRYLFVVNRVGQFAKRPGKISTAAPKALPRYEVIYDRFVLAGTHMQTYTRITSMESANESARHAVNAILQHADVATDRCDIWDPEDFELPDLQWLKDLDRELLGRNLPHFIKILGWSELPAVLLPAVGSALFAKGILIK